MSLSAERLRALEEALELVVALRRSVEMSETVQRDLDEDVSQPAQGRHAALVPARNGIVQSDLDEDVSQPAQGRHAALVPARNGIVQSDLDEDVSQPAQGRHAALVPARNGIRRKGTATQNAMSALETARDLGSRFISWIVNLIGRGKRKR
jgi:hypothetical protein